MSDLVITAANVLASAKAKRRQIVAGATITAGQTVYEDTADSSKGKLADNDASAATTKVAGIALHGASAGQPLELVEDDPEFTPGGTLTVGTIYVLSGTAGGIAPAADLASGDYPVILFVAYSASQGNLKIVRGSAPIPA